MHYGYSTLIQMNNTKLTTFDRFHPICTYFYFFLSQIGENFAEKEFYYLYFLLIIFQSCIKIIILFYLDSIRHFLYTNINIYNSQCLIFQAYLEQNPSGVLLGDSGYPLRRYLLTPKLNPGTPQEENFNRHHSRGRIVIERAFGILKSRFRYKLNAKTLMYLLYDNTTT